MPRLMIDGKEVTVEAGTSVLEAAKQVGMQVPHFCYHPKLSIAGNCRMCLVKIEGMPKPMISCQVQVKDDMVVDTQSEEVSYIRKKMLEFVLVNHPVDCPVCDQAGECKLQEYYMQHSLSDSQMFEEKVHKPKRVELGPQVMLDDERCVMCARCIRFSDEISKSGELCFSQRGDHQTLTTFPGMPLDNPYSMNNIDICPVGALTSRDFRFNCRVWFLKKTDSICNGCSKGCNITIEHHDNKIQRYKPRDNDDVNECWICDEGRLSYKAVHENRLLYAKNDQDQILKSDEVLQIAQGLMQNFSSDKIIFLGSARETLENNFALKKLALQLGQKEIYYTAHQVDKPYSDDILIEADKNPNRQGVELLGMKTLPAHLDLKDKLIIALGSSEDLPDLNQAQNLILLSSYAGSNASLQIPVASFAEQEGVFVNSQKRAQKLAAALDVESQVSPAWIWLQKIAATLNFQWNCDQSESLFNEACGHHYADLKSRGKIL